MENGISGGVTMISRIFSDKKSNLWLFGVLAICLFWMLVSVACKKGEKTPAVKQSDKTFSDLTGVEASEKWLQMLNTEPDLISRDAGKKAVKIVAIHPQGQLKEDSQSDELSITFSRPVAPLEQVTPGRDSLIHTEPSLKGEGYFKNAATYAFVVKEDLKPSTTYQVVFEGYESPFGFQVKKHQWEFSTPLISILKTIPSQDKKWQSLGQRVLVKFSQPVNPLDIKPYIRVTVDNQNWEHFQLRYSTEKERKELYYWQGYRKDPKKFITVLPTLPYPQAADIRISFLKGLTATAGNLGLPRNEVLKFRTFEKFVVEKVPETFNPDQGIEVHLSNQVRMADFLDRITIDPKIEINRDYYYRNEKFRIMGDFKPNTRYIVSIPHSIQDVFGNTLPRDYRFTVMSKDYTPHLIIPTGAHFVLESYLTRELPILVRNIKETGVLYKRLKSEDLAALVDGGRLDSERIDPEDCQVYSWQIPIHHNQSMVLPFKLDDIGIADPGVYYIKFNQATNYWGKKGSVFQLTDQALVAKYSPTQIFLTAFNLKNGTLQKQQKFNILGEKFRDRIKSGEDGVALLEPRDSIFLSRDLLKFKISSPESGAFIWGEKDTMFDMWSFRYDYNINYRYSPRSYYHRLLVFTDKDLYKAGQTVRFKGIFRHLVSGDLQIPELEKIEGEVYDSFNKKLETFPVDLSGFKEYGTFAHQFQLPRKSPSGFYRIQLKITQPGQEEPSMQNLNFSVQEYRPATFEVTTAFNQTHAVAGESLSGSIKGRYLFGTPMKEARGDFSLRIKNIYFTPPGWNRFTFGTAESATDRTIVQKSLVLDENGIFDFEQNKFSFDTKNSVQMSLYGEIRDKDNNRISSGSSMVVHRGAYYIGIRTGSYFFQSGKPGSVEIITVDPYGKQEGEHRLNMLIERVDWKSYQKEDASGSLRWYWERERHPVTEDEITVMDGQLSRAFTFDQPGYYEITLSGSDRLGNQITTTANFYVTGQGYVSWRMDEGRIIDLVTDKKEYREGETVELLIKSPFKKSTVLITAEREKVFWYKTFTLNGNAGTVKIPVLRDFMPNVFFNVILLKERTGVRWDDSGNDIGKPEFYAGYAGVKVEADSQKLNIDISADKDSYGPGDAVALDLTVTDHNGEPIASELCISVVDKGVLNLVGYELPDPFRYFYQERSLDVRTVSTLMDVLGRRKFSEKGEDPGGGAGVSTFGSVVVRKDFKESAFYQAFAYSNKQGKATINFTLPENLTTFKVMVVSVDNRHRFGRGKTDLLVKKELVLKPAMPDFLRPGDSFQGGVTVTNNTDEEMTVTVQAEVSEIQISGDRAEKKIRLSAFKTDSVLFDFKVPEGKKIHRFTFRARSDSYSDGYEQSITVRMPQITETVATSGEVPRRKAEELITVPTDSIREYDELKISWSPSISGGVEKSYQFLEEYPYECLEQKICRLFPLLKESSFLTRLGIITQSYEDRRERIETFINRMEDYQNADGGVGYYPDTRHSSWFLSTFTMDFLLDARKAGYQVSSEFLNPLREYLTKVCQNSIESRYPYSLNLRLFNMAYAAYVLARDGIIMQDTVNNLFEMRERLPLEGASYLIRIFDLTDELPDSMQALLTRMLLNNIKEEPTRTHFENRPDPFWWTVHGSSLRTTAHIFDTLLLVYQRFPMAPKIARWLFDTLRDKQYLNTQEHLSILRAFEKYFERYELEDPDYIARIILDKKERVNVQVSDRRFFQLDTFSLKDFDAGEQIRLKLQKEGKGIMYYNTRLTYRPAGILSPIDRGFEVRKVFLDQEGHPVAPDQLKAGENYIMELKVTTNKERSFVVVNDPLPAGFKVVNPRFRTQADLAVSNMEEGEAFRYWGDFYHSQYYFDRVELFADFLTAGTHTWKYLVIAANSGEYQLPATLVLQMYNPEVFGRNADQRVKIK